MALPLVSGQLFPLQQEAINVSNLTNPSSKKIKLTKTTLESPNNSPIKKEE